MQSLWKKLQMTWKLPQFSRNSVRESQVLPGHIPEIWVQGRNMLVWMKIADLHYLSLCDPSCPHLLDFYNGMFFMNCRMSWVEPDRFKIQMLHFASLKVWPKTFLCPNNLILIDNDFVCVVVSTVESWKVWLTNGFSPIKGKKWDRNQTWRTCNQASSNMWQHIDMSGVNI